MLDGNGRMSGMELAIDYDWENKNTGMEPTQHTQVSPKKVLVLRR
jgi:hypothetical protein